MASPWNQQPVRSPQGGTPSAARDTKNKPSKAKKYFEDFEVWVGGREGWTRKGGEVRRRRRRRGPCSPGPKTIKKAGVFYFCLGGQHDDILEKPGRPLPCPYLPTYLPTLLMGRNQYQLK